MNLSRRWNFFAITIAFAAVSSSFAHAQTNQGAFIEEQQELELQDHYFSKELLNDENWNDSKLFPSINPKSRPQTDPTGSDEYLKLPFHLRKSQVAQLLAGLIQYRVIGVFHRQPSYYSRMYQKWTTQTPSKFNYLKIHSDRYQPQIENSLTFINSKYEYRGISDKAIGYCYGVSTVFKKFTNLAFFSENVAPEDQVPEKGTPAWYGYYMQRLAAVLKGEATLFPGFKNLRELTLVPEFEFYLKVQVTKEWKRSATLRSTLRSYVGNTKEMKADEVNELVHDLKARLKRGEFPKILFASAITKTFLTGGARTHAVLVTKVEELPEEKRTKIHIWDINFYGEDLVKRPYFLDILRDDSGKPTIRYQEWSNPSHDTKKKYLRTELPGDRIGQVIVAGENNRETVEAIDAIEEFCAKPQHGHPDVETQCDIARYGNAVSFNSPI